ncbi:hypothetical protein E2C01_005727 [Portunus trituberculatus]|uniref:Uncharacterized protein n=1 Tax=Portunus trituberculatus TaxID=210409 RepID=A0A5B7CU91_PORTR|nr:hypothetical protein [Portunus trituberculatus]
MVTPQPQPPLCWATLGDGEGREEGKGIDVKDVGHVRFDRTAIKVSRRPCPSTQHLPETGSRVHLCVFPFFPPVRTIGANTCAVVIASNDGGGVVSPYHHPRRHINKLGRLHNGPPS